MLSRLYNRLFVCRKYGHSPAPPKRGTHGELSDYCDRCGGYLYRRGRK